MGIHCRDFVDLVTGYLDRALDADDESRFVDHLACCPGCQRYLDQMCATIGLLRAVALTPQPEGS
ncbi:MAG TPA: zf-HC2 domain-containing protein [Actinomycetes bacterium]|nr:zf-HC2 domain-containing protein [Actinomycetes bacterium]